MKEPCAFQETDYEYFEQRGGLMRPPPGPGPMGADFPGGPHPPMLTRPLLPTESSKLDNRQEEVRTSNFWKFHIVTGKHHVDLVVSGHHCRATMLNNPNLYVAVVI